MSRHERRRIEKEASKHFARKGINLEDKGVTIALLTRQMIKILANGRTNKRASKVARLAQRSLDHSMHMNPPEYSPACTKGCSYCCRNFVSLSAPQAFVIADHIRSAYSENLDAAVERIFAAEEQTRDVDQERRYTERQPCALLVDDVCSVYEARPTTCRGWASIDVSMCEKWLDDIPTPGGYIMFRGAADNALWAALRKFGLHYGGYELNHAVRVALEVEDAEQRWLNGEDIFANVMRDETATELADFNERFLDALISAADGNTADILNFKG